jgi:hypothetical protein
MGTILCAGSEFRLRRWGGVLRVAVGGVEVSEDGCFLIAAFNLMSASSICLLHK